MAEDNWDLQAVVRGFGRAKQEPAKDPPFPTSCSSTSSSSSVLLHESKIVKQDDVFGFPDLISTSAPLQELLELCKPFFPSPSPLQQPQQKQKPQVSASPQPNRFSSGVSCFRQPLQLPMPPRIKRRKNQQKKVVCQVLAGNHSDDLWAWRKYGQKPIKGSPFPRGYYRCSSSKSCIARKQVERSRMDPGVFIVTYTGEHNHPIPTHRNSLAGSTRHKIPPVPVPITSSTGETTDVLIGVALGREENNTYQGTNTTPSGLSPTTPLTLAVVEEEEEEEDDLLMVSDMDILAEDDMLFMG